MATGWQASRGKPLEQRVRDLEDQLAQSNARLEALVNGTLPGAGDGTGGSGSGTQIRFPIPENKIKFDELEGHDHSGLEGEGKQVAHASLTSPGSALLDALRHSDTASATPVRGDLIRGDSSALWGRLAIGTATRVLKSDGTDPSWSFVAHSELSGTGSNLLNGSSHSDTANASPSNGDLIARISGVWNRLAVGTNDYFLRVVTGAPTWVQLAFTMITGAITAAQHGNLTSTAGTTADHDGTLSANARVAVRKNSTGSVSTRRRLNLIEGSNVTITVADDSGNEEVDITIAQTSVSAATVIVKDDGSVVAAAADTVNFIGELAATESPSGQANIVWTGFTAKESGSAVNSVVKSVDYGSGFDVATDGGDANEVNVNLDLSEVVTGDVTYTGNAGKVVAIQNKDIAAPVSGDDGKSVVYDDGTGDFVYAFPGEFSETLWSRENVSGAATSFGAMPQPGANGANIPSGWQPHKPGKITGISISCDGTLAGSGGATYEATVYLNGVATAVTLLINTGVTGFYADFSGSPVSFLQGAIIHVYDKRTGTISAGVGNHVSVFMRFDV